LLGEGVCGLGGLKGWGFGIDVGEGGAKSTKPVRGWRFDVTWVLKKLYHEI